MKTLLKPVLSAGLILAAASPIAAVPAFAQTAAPAVKGIGVINIGTIVQGASAFQTAEQQRPTTYKQYYDQAKVRADQINAQLKPLVEKQQADSQAATPDQAKLKQQGDQIQQIYQQGQRDVDSIMAPVYLSRAYVDEQIEDVLPKAIKQAADKRGVSLVLRSDTDAVVYRDPTAYDMDTAVITELNALLPVAQLVPPPGWLPREMRQQQAARQAAAGVQPATGDAAPAATSGQATGR